MKKALKKLLYYIQLFDGIWSVPLGFFIFFFVGLLLSYSFGMAVGNYDLAFIQPLFLSGTVVIGSTNMAVLGIFFTFRRIHRYLYGRDNGETIINQSKIDFNNLNGIQKICVSLYLFCFFVVAILVVYLNLV